LKALTAAFLLAILVSPPAHPQELAPGESLVAEGIPKIPAELAEEIGRYTEFRSAAFSSWHPTKREMLVGTRFGNTSQIHRVSAPGAARTQLTFFPDRARNGLYEPTRGEFFVFTKDRGGDEFFQFYRYDLADGAITLVTDGKSRNTGPVWSHGGKWLAYGSTRRTGKDVDLYVVDPRDPKTERRVAELAGGGWFVSDWSPDDAKLLVTEAVSANESYLWIFDVATGAKTAVTPRGAGEKVAYGAALFRKDGKGLFVTTDRGSEFQRLATLGADGRGLEFRTPDTADVDEIDLSRDGRTLAFVTNEKGVSALHLLDVATGSERPAPKLPVGVVSGVRWHPDGGAIAFDLESARSPEDVYSLDVASGRLDRWTFSETGGLNASTFAEPELVSWKSFDGREITGFLYRPPAKFSGRRPVLLEIHGGPEGQARPDFLGSWNYVIQELGVAVLLPNVRGSTGYGKTFLAADNGVLREGAYRDVGALLDWIGKRPDLDPARVAVGGGSYGGHMTLAVSYLYSDRIRCSVDVVGPSNFVTFLRNTSGYRQDLRRVEYGDERDPRVRAFLERTAPLTNAEKIRRPLFIVQGANDPRVPRSESEQMLAKIRGVGTPVWYLMAKDEGHGFAKKSNRDFQFAATVLFLKQHLLR
jgi:dipeptidyl aminopeptidase/acylaminoacyl peptidase